MFELILIVLREQHFGFAVFFLSFFSLHPDFSHFNRTGSSRSFYDSKWPSQNFYQMNFGKIRGVGEIYPPITLNLKNGTKIIISNLMSPVRNLYDCSFYINLKCSMGMSPCPEGCREGLVPSKTFFPDLSTTLSKMAISKF